MGTVNLQAVSRLLAPLKRRIQLMVDRAVVTMVQDSTQRQNLQIRALASETNDDIERFQNYGHTSVPPKGSEAIILSLGGSRSGLIAIAAEDKKVRLNGLKEGDSALYHLEGHFFKLTENGVGELEAEELNIRVKRVNIIAEESVDITTPNANFSDDVTVGGNLNVTEKVTAKNVEGTEGGVFAGVDSVEHTHREQGDNLPVSPPLKESV